MMPLFLLRVRRLCWTLAALLLLAGCTVLSSLAIKGQDSTAVTDTTATTAAIQSSSGAQLIPTPLPIAAEMTGEQASLINLYARTNPGVVNITVYARSRQGMMPAGQGSGFIYTRHGTTGTVVTNNHVVQDADQLDVTFAGGIVRSAKVIGQDPHSDLAVLKVSDLPAGVKPLPLGSMDELAVGQTVIAIGNPFGLDGTLTRGVVSALGRTIPVLTSFSIPQAIQTDAAINPGNSGGPLLDLHGHVIGVNAQIETDGRSRSNSGVGFAIPINIVERVVPTLVEEGEYAWAWLGVRGGNVTPALVKAMDLPAESGAYLLEVVSSGPADRAALRGADEVAVVDERQIPVGGDVVTAIDDRPVRSFDDLLIYIALEAGPGQEVTLTLLRDGQPREVSVALERRPQMLAQETLPFNHP